MTTFASRLDPYNYSSDKLTKAVVHAGRYGINLQVNLRHFTMRVLLKSDSYVDTRRVQATWHRLSVYRAQEFRQDCNIGSKHNRNGRIAILEIISSYWDERECSTGLTVIINYGKMR
jgi:hypothetical protein